MDKPLSLEEVAAFIGFELPDEVMLAAFDRVVNQLYDTMRENETLLQVSDSQLQTIEAQAKQLRKFANPLDDLAERKLPPKVDAYRRKVEPKSPKHFDENA